MTARAWVLLRSKRRLDLLDPTPFDWEISDLAHGVARTLRWGGASVWEWPLSVAQHSLLVLEIGRMAAANGLSPELELAYLVHDGSEGLGVGFDPISPLKPFLGEGYQNLDRRLQKAIHLRLGLPAALPAAWKAAIKLADKRAAASEAVHVAGWTPEEVRGVLKIRHKPMDDDPLLRRYGGTPWEPWSANVAAARYEAELNRLLARRR